MLDRPRMGPSFAIACPGDITGDCIINGADPVGIMISFWTF